MQNYVFLEFRIIKPFQALYTEVFNFAYSVKEYSHRTQVRETAPSQKTQSFKY